MLIERDRPFSLSYLFTWMSCRQQPYDDKSKVNCRFAAFILDLLKGGDLKKLKKIFAIRERKQQIPK